MFSLGGLFSSSAARFPFLHSGRSFSFPLEQLSDAHEAAESDATERTKRLLCGHSWERDGRHIHEHITLDNYTHSTDVFAREAARMIWEHDPARPLFLFLPFTAPHWPNQFYQHHADANAHIRSARRREVSRNSDFGVA